MCLCVCACFMFVYVCMPDHPTKTTRSVKVSSYKERIRSTILEFNTFCAIIYV